MTQPAATPTATLRSLNWTYVLVGAADATLLPFIPLLLVERGLSASVIGLVLAGAASGSFTIGLVCAYLADRRWSAERMVVVGSAGAASAAMLLNLPGVVSVGLIVIALSLVRSPFMLLDPIALRRLRQARRTDYARIRLRMSAGWAASSLVAGALFQGFGLRLIPYIYGPLTLLFGTWMWRTVKPMPQEPRLGANPQARPLTRIPLAFAGFLVSCFLLGASLAATQNFLTLQIDFLGGGAFLIGAAAAFQALAEIPTMAYMQVLTRRFGHRLLFAIGCGIYLAIFIAWAFVSVALTAALLKLVAGIAFALTYVAAVMIANDLVPAHLRATGQALMKSVLFGVAPILGSLGGGLVYEAFGARVMFLAATAVVGAAGLMALVAVPARTRSLTEEVALPAPEVAPAVP
jgi:PPP family 3-phenylpropionic acid transporter